MNETQLHHEADEITDSQSFSIVAIAGFALSLAGVFSIGYLQMLPVAIVGCLMGAFVLLTAKRFRLNALSRFLGFVAVVLGSISATWGISERNLGTGYDLAHARKISELYLQSLSANDLNNVYYLVGFQFEGESPEERQGKESTEIQRAKKRLETDAAHVEIQKRKDTAKWVFVSLDGEFQGTLGHTYRLRYRDVGQTIAPEYWVYARKDCGKYETKDKVHWFVDNLEQVKKS